MGIVCVRYSGATMTANHSGLHMLEVLQRREEEFCGGMNARASFLGWTALHYAALADSVSAARVLLGSNTFIAMQYYFH